MEEDGERHDMTEHRKHLHRYHPSWVKRLTRTLLSILLILAVFPTLTPFSPGSQAALANGSDGSLTRALAITVAASDSSAAVRASADYLCDGVNDQQEIQAALAALPASGGEVVLTAGTFRCKGNLAPKAHTTLRGQGESKTSLAFTNSALLVDEEYSHAGRLLGLR